MHKVYVWRWEGRVHTAGWIEGSNEDGKKAELHFQERKKR